LSNTTLLVWNSTNNLVYNSTKNISGTSNSTTFQYNFTDESSYEWNCQSFNNNSQSNSAESNFTITYDATKPNITLVLPENSKSYTSNSQEIIFQYNVSDNFNVENCSLIISNQVNLTNSSIVNFSETKNFTQTFSTGSYIWGVNCTDKTNNEGNSSQRNFTITAPAVIQPSSSGGGGGSSTNTYTATAEQASSGYTKYLRKNEKIKFIFFDENAEEHTLTLNEIGSNFANITIKSDPINFLLGIGQSIKLNLTSHDYYNLYIKLEDISSNRAKITIQTIHEEIPKPQIPAGTGEVVKEENITQEEDKTEEKEKLSLLEIIKNLVVIRELLIIILIIVVIFTILKGRKVYKGKKLENSKDKKKK